MTAQHPAAPETETDANGLTEAEREALPFGPAYYPAVERIVAERVRVVEGERDAAVERLRGAYSCGEWADLIAERNREFRRAESAEAAHEAEKAAHERLRAEARAELFSENASAVMHGVTGTHPESYGGVTKDEALECATDLIERLRTLLAGGRAR